MSSSQQVVLITMILISNIIPHAVFTVDCQSTIPMGSIITDTIDVDYEPHCSVVIISDTNILDDQSVKVIGIRDVQFGVFQSIENGALDKQNRTQMQIIVSMARKVRLMSKCVNFFVVSEDLTFLEDFGEQSLKGRLLVWASEILVITRLSFSQISKLLTDYWTFSMMNAAVLNLDIASHEKGGLYSCRPYGSGGKSQIIKVASWSEKEGFTIPKDGYFYYDKFSNFHGSGVNVTALPYTPHWVETTTNNPDGTVTKILGGTDYQLLFIISQKLNFTINVLETSSWNEVASFVEMRKSFMAAVFHNVLPQRLERYDYSYTYEYGPLDFSVAKPELKPQWQSLYYPLSDEVWLAILGVLICIPFILHLASFKKQEINLRKETLFNSIVETVIGTFFGQPLHLHLPQNSPFRISMAAWLVFTFIVGTAYRGNLTASLTIPKYPPRVETVEQLVNTFDSITIPPFGNEFIKFFKQSDNQLYKEMAEKMSIVPSVMDGLKLVVEKKDPHVAGGPYMQQKIASFFSSSDGTTQIYIGRESLLPGISAWPIPHDAPYTSHINKIMISVIEAGLYNQWRKDMLFQARQESIKRQKRIREQQDQNIDAEDDTASAKETASIKALTVIHMQGPLMILLLGLILGTGIFVGEITHNKITNH